MGYQIPAFQKDILFDPLPRVAVIIFQEFGLDSFHFRLRHKRKQWLQKDRVSTECSISFLNTKWQLLSRVSEDVCEGKTTEDKKQNLLRRLQPRWPP